MEKILCATREFSTQKIKKKQMKYWKDVKKFYDKKIKNKMNFSPKVQKNFEENMRIF